MLRPRFFLAPLALVAGVILAGSTLLSGASTDAASPTYEVWAFDQADTAEGGGGQLFIWDGHDLERHAGRAQPDVIDLAELAAASEANCDLAQRPHMALPNHSDPPSHVIVANVASGDVHFVNVDTRQIDGCVGGLGAAHAAVPDRDNEMILVADIGGQTLHKISTDYDDGIYAKTEALFLGTHGVLDKLGTDTANPICHEFAASGLVYVTLSGGGLIVVDPGSDDGTTPMEVVHVYAAADVPGVGCGAFPLKDGRMITNGESGQFGGDDFLFVFDPPASPEGPFEPPVTIELPGDDTHGVEICETPGGDLYAWTVMRVSNHINIIDLQTHEVVRTWSMDRPFSPDPKPDLAMAHGNSLFVTLRGPKPLTAITALQNSDRVPAVAVLTMHRNCQTFNYGAKDVAPMPNPNTTVIDGVEVTTSDPHGLAIVPRE